MRLFPEKLSYFTFSLEIYTGLPCICMYPHTETCLKTKSNLLHLCYYYDCVFDSYYPSWYKVIIQHPEDFPDIFNQSSPILHVLFSVLTLK